MSEKFPAPEVVPPQSLMEVGEEILRNANTPRELIVAMRNWALMCEDVKNGKYIEIAERWAGSTHGHPNPYEALKLRDELGMKDEGRGVENALYVMEETQKKFVVAFTTLLERAWQKFSESNPSSEELDLFREQIPELASRADSLKL